MVLKKLNIEGAYLIESFSISDERGIFVKPFSNNFDKENLINFKTNEIYYSRSKKNVIRGMHFQIPPYENSKLIFLLSGSVIDVIFDLRHNSRTYNQYTKIKLSPESNALFIPSGVAHGFLSLDNDTVMVYNQSTTYSKNHDKGILWNSFGYNWPVARPLLSSRDKKFPSLKSFDNPF